MSAYLLNLFAVRPYRAPRRPTGRVNYAFPNPFRVNHCVVLAWTHLAGQDADFARRLASRASLERTWSGFQSNGAVTNSGARSPWWSEAVGLRVIKRVQLLKVPPAFHSEYRDSVYTPVAAHPTLDRFAKTHRAGRFYVRVQGHAVAVIDGQIFGYYKPRTRVLEYIEVAPKTQEV